MKNRIIALALSLFSFSAFAAKNDIVFQLDIGSQKYSHTFTKNKVNKFSWVVAPTNEKAIRFEAQLGEVKKGSQSRALHIKATDIANPKRSFLIKRGLIPRKKPAIIDISESLLENAKLEIIGL